MLTVLITEKSINFGETLLQEKDVKGEFFILTALCDRHKPNPIQL